MLLCWRSVVGWLTVLIDAADVSDADTNRVVGIHAIAVLVLLQELNNRSIPKDDVMIARCVSPFAYFLPIALDRFYCGVRWCCCAMHNYVLYDPFNLCHLIEKF